MTPALQLEKPKEQRSRFRHTDKWKSREHPEIAKSLADLLRDCRRRFPGFASRIDQFIAQVEADSLRSRSYDRERVVGQLRAWGFGLTIKELMDDTGFTHWDIRQILADLIKRNIVSEHWELRNGNHSKQRVKVYKLR